MSDEDISLSPQEAEKAQDLVTQGSALIFAAIEESVEFYEGDDWDKEELSPMTQAHKVVLVNLLEFYDATYGESKGWQVLRDIASGFGSRERCLQALSQADGFYEAMITSIDYRAGKYGLDKFLQSN
eukprot:TRINITY_DN10411_c0_g1_i1.p1 TRINITY_DN10411_c0_g1~~TRINITY_DN10411_c0_g1_i1.p1  ORF type:complete len:127 (+),score=16.73 TRINITY_DN10411_c0_g1_i1:93-473(+)